MKDTIEFRRATIDDVPIIANVHAKAHWETYAPLFGSTAQALDLQLLEQRWYKALRNNAAALIAIDRGNIVGLAMACGEHIDAVYLLAAYRSAG